LNQVNTSHENVLAEAREAVAGRIADADKMVQNLVPDINGREVLKADKSA
jgi:hypothetical protein